MALHGFCVLCRWRAVEQIKAQRAVFNAGAQHINNAATGDFPLQTRQEFLPRHALCVLRVANAKLGPFQRLRGLQKRKQLGDVDGKFAVIRRCAASEPAAAVVARGRHRYAVMQIRRQAGGAG